MENGKKTIITITDTDERLGIQVQSSGETKRTEIMTILMNALMMEREVPAEKHTLVWNHLVDALYSDEDPEADEGDFKTQLVIRESEDTLQLAPIAEGLTVGKTQDLLIDSLFMAADFPKEERPRLKEALESVLAGDKAVTA